MNHPFRPDADPALRNRLRRASVLALFLAGASALASAAPERPAALQALEKQGVTIVGTFPAPGGLTAWAGYIGQRPLSLFVTPDGKHVIAGTLVDARGEEVAEAALEKAVRGPMTDGAWSKLEASHWIE